MLRAYKALIDIEWWPPIQCKECESCQAFSNLYPPTYSGFQTERKAIVVLFDQWLFRHQSSPPTAPGINTKSVVQLVERIPYLEQIRSFWDEFYDMREWWPFLLPLLVWVGWRTYRKELRATQRS